jgi:predicted glycogen debranching enzyme
VTIRIELQSPVTLDNLLGREWLVTNGLGGFASSTIAGVNTRRYHGLLVAAMEPPVKRMLLLAQLEEWLLLPGEDPLPLSAQEYWDGTIYPDGFSRLGLVEVDGMLPCFQWTIAGRTIEKRVWMEQNVNRTVISYRLIDGPPTALRLRPLLAHRDYHEQRHGPGGFDMAETTDGWIVDAGGVRSYLDVRSTPTVASAPDWYWRVLHRAEAERGLDAEEDLFTPGVCEVSLAAQGEVAVIAATEAVPPGWSVSNSLAAAQRRQSAPLGPDLTSPLATQLVIAAEQFRVARADDSRSVIAGYHWFTDWGRDSMISLPGLAMRPGSLWEARAVLETNLRYLDRGLIPNRFPDRGEAPEYNTMDATLWMFQALASYLRASGDWRFILARLDQLEEIVAWHLRGTHHNIRVDEADGLLAGGEEGYALTWMDARVQDWVVTPRRGKPIEINALWYNALRQLALWCERAGKPAARYHGMAARAFESAQRRYWFSEGGYLYDCLDGPDGDDASLRPNQVIALGLGYPLLEGERAKSVLDVVSAKLLTPYGLRTLSPDDPRYRSVYQGDQQARDAAYHMGTVWPWLLGPYLDAHRRIYRDAKAARELLEPFASHLGEAGLGTISEIFEPEPPYRPVGCIAQAWSVAEVLRQANLAD